jgi:hypothetical protein
MAITGKLSYNSVNWYRPFLLESGHYVNWNILYLHHGDILHVKSCLLKTSRKNEAISSCSEKINVHVTVIRSTEEIISSKLIIKYLPTLLATEIMQVATIPFLLDIMIQTWPGIQGILASAWRKAMHQYRYINAISEEFLLFFYVCNAVLYIYFF